jgi:hypothetical protein
MLESLPGEFFRREQTKCSTLAAWTANTLFMEMFKFSKFLVFKERNFVREKMKTLMKYWGIGSIFSTMESSKLINCRTCVEAAHVLLL